MAHAIEVEIDRNFDFFMRNVSDFIERHRGQFALLRHSSVVGFHNSVKEAEETGVDRFSDGIFSIQEVSDDPVDLGFYTYAADNRDPQ